MLPRWDGRALLYLPRCTTDCQRLSLLAAAATPASGAVLAAKPSKTYARVPEPLYIAARWTDSYPNLPPSELHSRGQYSCAVPVQLP